ncbi:hypothetical protein IWW40_001872 [Coemansia sp. RSA 1250]|nr:hypothetical protein IWW40_001872 [Coemansia sp. RSA 1250]
MPEVPEPQQPAPSTQTIEETDVWVVIESSECETALTSSNAPAFTGTPPPPSNSIDNESQTMSSNNQEASETPAPPHSMPEPANPQPDVTQETECIDEVISIEVTDVPAPNVPAPANPQPSITEASECESETPVVPSSTFAPAPSAPAPVNPQPEQPQVTDAIVIQSPVPWSSTELESSDIEATAAQSCLPSTTTVTVQAEATCLTVTVTETAFVPAYQYVLPGAPGPVVWTNVHNIPAPIQTNIPALSAVPMPPPAVTEVNAEHTQVSSAPCASSWVQI